MITNDFSAPLQLSCALDISNGIAPDKYIDSSDEFTTGTTQEINIPNRPAADYLQSTNFYQTTNSESAVNSTFITESHYDINVAVHMSPTVQLNTVPPPPYNAYANAYPGIAQRNLKKKADWKQNVNIYQECNEEENTKGIHLENNGARCKIARSGYKSPYDHLTSCNNNNNHYRFSKTVSESSNSNSVAQYRNGNNFNRNRFHSGNRKRQYYDYNRHYHSDDVIRPVRGLMERFMARGTFFQIKPILSLFGNSTPLDQAIWDLYSAKAQTQNTYFHKLELWKNLYLHITKIFDRYGLFMVGSTMSGLGTENSDIDMCLLIRSTSADPRSDAVRYLEMIKTSLQACGFVKSPEVIHAKVPILKFKGSQYGFEVDLNCNNAVGIRNTHLLYCYAQLDWRVRPLIIIAKLWAKANSINDAKNMTISSYSLALMVLHFLQCGVTPPVIPCLHGLYRDKFNSDIEIHDIDIQEELPKFYSDNKQTLGELLQGFLQYYANFSFDTYAISIRLAARIAIDECRYARSHKNDPHQWKFICIEEPFDLTNTARSVYDFFTFKRIQRVFQVSNNVLRETKNLSCILMNISDNQR